MAPHNGSGRPLALVEALATVFIWGGTFVATKIALQEVSPATVVWLRFAMGLVVLGLTARLRGELGLPPRGEWAYLTLLGVVGVGFHQWLQSTGLQTAQATTTAWIVATIPVFITILGWLVLKERLSRSQLAGMLFAVLGVLLIVSKGDPTAVFRGTTATVGDILVMISAPNWAIYTILSRPGLRRLPAARMIFYVMLAGWIFITIWIMGFGPGLSEIGLLSQRGWTAISALGILGSGLAYVMYQDALRVLTASQLGVFLNIEPLTTMLLAAPLLGEAISVVVILGGALILLGVYLVNRTTAAPAESSAPRELPE